MPTDQPAAAFRSASSFFTYCKSSYVVAFNVSIRVSALVVSSFFIALPANSSKTSTIARLLQCRSSASCTSSGPPLPGPLRLHPAAGAGLQQLRDPQSDETNDGEDE